MDNSIALELIAQMALHTLQIAPATPRLKPALLKKHFERKHGPDAYYGQGQSKEKGHIPMKNIPEVTIGLMAVSRDCFPVELSRKRRISGRSRMCEGRHPGGGTRHDH